MRKKIVRNKRFMNCTSLGLIERAKASKIKSSRKFLNSLLLDLL